MSTCDNNPKNSSSTKISKHTASGYSIFSHCSFDNAENKLDYYRGNDSMKKFCIDLKEQATKIINFEKKEIIPLTNEENESYLKQEDFHNAKKDLFLIFFIIFLFVI